MTAPVRVAIAGLGKVAWRFDAEPGRRVVWTHLSAYRALGGMATVLGGCDPSADARGDFSKAHPDIPVFASIAAMIEKTGAEVLSICSPAQHHGSSLRDALGVGSVRVVWCEKPLAPTLAEASDMVEACARAGATLVVNHVRRWTPLWRRTGELLAAGAIGSVRSLRVSMPNRILSVGSHAVDLAVMLGGRVREASVLDIPSLAQDGEPARAALLNFQSGATGAVLVTGMKDRLVVDFEAFGDDGHMRVREDKGEIVIEPFQPSGRFDRYFERGEAAVERLPTLTESSPFLPAAQEVVRHAREPGGAVTCGGEDALETIRVLDLMQT